MSAGLLAGACAERSYCGDGACSAGEPGACRDDCGPYCGDLVCDAEDLAAACAADCPVPGDVDLRLTSIAITRPPSLALFNGIVAARVEEGLLNVVVRIRDLGGTPTIEMLDADAAPLGEGYVLAGPGTVLLGRLDPEAHRLQSVPVFTLSYAFVMDLYTDTPDPDSVLVQLEDVALDLLLDGRYASVVGDEDASPSTVSGYLSVEWACAVEVAIGTSTLNVLDILDGGDDLSATTTPGSCAPGASSENIPPDVDLDGDATLDAYLVTATVGGARTTVLDER